MSLRTRLILAFGYLVMLLVLTGVVTAFGYHRLDRELQRAQSDQTRSVTESIALVETIGLDEGIATNTVRETIIADLARHQIRVESSQSRARAVIRRGALQLGILTTIALLSMTFLSTALQRSILTPLGKLQGFGEAVAGGSTHLRINLPGNDELAILARRLNSALDYQMDTQSQFRGMLSHDKLVILAMLNSLGRPAALFDLNGELAASTLADGDEKVFAIDREHLTREASDMASQTKTPSDAASRRTVKLSNGKIADLSILSPRPNCAVGWLLTLQS